MLKFTKAALVLSTFTLGFAMPAKADVNEALANICTIVKADDKSELRKKLRTVQSDFNMKLHDYYDGITCDGNSLIRTALLNNAVETGSLMIKKMPGKALQNPEQDGKTLTVWIEEQGLQSSPIFAQLNERI